RRLRRAKPGGVEQSERDRHLPEDVTGLPLTDHALHAVDEPEHLDPPPQDAEQRARVTLMDGELAGSEGDVRDYAGKPLAFGPPAIRENSEPTDLLGRHHESNASPFGLCARLARSARSNEGSRGTSRGQFPSGSQTNADSP